ncbi:hypothetical protein [Pedobacter jeongneungensis]|uniref:hypothetical protein n=1 Tax=Pedobacter jeongneungensis TaxID=947309 RepID=UPI000468DAAB|nr:hypothetical protein [Pedobacter jeongneungensis]
MINIRSNFQTQLLNSNSTTGKNFFSLPVNARKGLTPLVISQCRAAILALGLMLFALSLTIKPASAQSAKTSVTPNLHKTNNLISHLTKLSPSNLFLKGQKPVNGLTYHYSNWNGKGGIQVFSGGENVKMLSIIAISNAESLSHLKTPIPIDQLITDLLGKADAEWFSQRLPKLTTLKKELYSKDKQVAIAYDQHVQKLTVTLRLL